MKVSNVFGCGSREKSMAIVGDALTVAGVVSVLAAVAVLRLGDGHWSTSRGCQPSLPTPIQTRWLNV
ncbi:hypothetical protein RRG08_029481 [Elysia crispata]|uniref:Uncharacterized protein n=1 Tax=Elysia crispata TaxID=231223 RepID=A0AAE1B4E8_9GAST|nr:hypothetical protein RRG08_029481 [Elysia crispata]